MIEKEPEYSNKQTNNRKNSNQAVKGAASKAYNDAQN
jgi:hypothetical protein